MTIHGSPYSALSSNSRAHAAVGELVAVRIARMLARDTVGIGMQQHVAEQVRRHVGGRLRYPGASAVAIAGAAWSIAASPHAIASATHAAGAEGRQRLPAFDQRIANASAVGRAPRSARRGRRPARVRLRRVGASSIAARRGCVPSASMRLAERRDRAARRARRAGAAARAPRRARRAAVHRRSADWRSPQPASSSARPASSTWAISARRCGSRRCDSGHSR